MQLRRFLLSLVAPPTAEHLKSIPDNSRPPGKTKQAKGPSRATEISVVAGGSGF
jgi:hypothetical protein